MFIAMLLLLVKRGNSLFLRSKNRLIEPLNRSLCKYPITIKLAHKSNVEWNRSTKTFMHTHTHTEPNFLLLKTKLWTNADRSVTVATATPPALLELNKSRKSLKFLPHYLPWKHFLIADESWIALFDCHRVLQSMEKAICFCPFKVMF